MALSAGTRLGPYEIVSLLGVGSIGEVYRARDATLHRDVALKVPGLFEGSNVVQALVLELIEGPTLAERIAQGPIPADEAASIARQIQVVLNWLEELKPRVPSN